MSAANPVAELYRNHHGWLCAWLRRRLDCPERAADLAQDTFLRIITSRDALFAMRAPRAYLTTTANRLLIDQTRRAAIERAYLAELAGAANSLAVAGHPSPEDLLIATQTLVQIGDALQQVPRKAGEAFLLHYLDGLGHAEVAARLKVSTRMVRKYLVQCLVRCASPGLPSGMTS
ncbi:RNA polymerase, sigma 19 factor; KpLE2 phage-like element [Sterolibacterium denitrificans]|uniref:RNA polymerase, sigma 19 factor KpLE2 phage-like element n=2 Tax=Sterolibacterium denitrificans TaxID=157592 RepID=A0A7Z7MUM5_9PROT|nr:sigma-70 family RNA polymerase sigma factor [Sterolibacterium denitrificans]KYC28956.1 RNA polymerase sigma factor [Sterolibacterium denitrificans]SMB23131.1 RNA polymerase, sigma 19 factor; KpLE2 phage-like element [Sterolibacterium denitrificans]